MHFRHLLPTGMFLLLTQCASSTRQQPTTPIANTQPDAAVEAAVAPPPSAPAPLASGRLPDTAIPLRYSLRLHIDPSQERFQGTAQIRVRVPRPTRFVVLHGHALNVRVVGFDPAQGERIEGTTSMRMSTGAVGDPEEMVVTFPREIPGGEGTLSFEYDAPFDTSLRGLYRVRSGELWYAYTQFESMDARRAFPCFDEPGFKVPWEVTVVAPRGQLAVANMPETGHEDDAAANTTTYRFAPTPATPSYLVAVAVGAFDVVEGARTPVPIRAITTRGQANLTRAALEAAADHLRILGDYFGRAYPYPKLDIVAVPEFEAGAMENPGLVTFREEMLLLDPARAPTIQYRRMAEVMAHELAHQWFGNLVTMAWWNDLWLNEAFASWMEVHVTDRWRPAFNARLESVRERGWAMGVDSLPATRAVRQPVVSSSDAAEAFDAITYTKGAAVIRMLEQWLGPEVFQQGIRRYLSEHEWGNATAADLMQALESAAGHPVGPVAGTFVDQPGVPLVRVELQCAAATGAQATAPRLRLSQERYRVPAEGVAPTPDQTWRVPVCVLYENGARPGRACTVIESANAEIELTGVRTCPRWIQPNAGEAGYYRYAITPAVAAMVAPATLRTLDVPTRIGYLDNAWALVRGGALSSADYLRLLEAFRSERSRPVVEALLGTVFDLYRDVAADDDTRARLRTWTQNFLRPLGRELGWDARANEDDERKLLRRTVLNMLGVMEDAATLAEAERRTFRYLQDPRSVPGDIAALAVPLASRRAPLARVEQLLTALRTAPTPADRSLLVTALGSFLEPATLRRALDASLTDAIRVQDLWRLFYSSSGDPTRRPVVLAWTTEHFEQLRVRLPGALAGRLAFLTGTGCTAEERTAAQTFWAERARQYEGAEREVRQGLERVSQCIALRTRESAHLTEALRRTPPAR